MYVRGGVVNALPFPLQQQLKGKRCQLSAFLAPRVMHLKSRTIQKPNADKPEILDDVIQNYYWCDNCGTETVINEEEEEDVTPKSKHNPNTVTRDSKLFAKKLKGRKPREKTIWDNLYSNISDEDLEEIQRMTGYTFATIRD